MSKHTDKFMRVMNAILLDCDKATLYATQHEMKQLGCVKRMQLKMHLATCELCRTFVKQSKIINDQVGVFQKVDETNLKLHLSGPQKEKIQKIIDAYLK
jgi:hypothetical protein